MFNPISTRENYLVAPPSGQSKGKADLEGAEALEAELATQEASPAKVEDEDNWDDPVAPAAPKEPDSNYVSPSPNKAPRKLDTDPQVPRRRESGLRPKNFRLGVMLNVGGVHFYQNNTINSGPGISGTLKLLGGGQLTSGLSVYGSLGLNGMRLATATVEADNGASALLNLRAVEVDPGISVMLNSPSRRYGNAKLSFMMRMGLDLVLGRISSGNTAPNCDTSSAFLAEQCSKDPVRSDQGGEGLAGKGNTFAAQPGFMWGVAFELAAGLKIDTRSGRSVVLAPYFRTGQRNHGTLNANVPANHYVPNEGGFSMTVYLRNFFAKPAPKSK